MMRGNFLQRQIMKRALKEQYGAAVGFNIDPFDDSSVEFIER